MWTIKTISKINHIGLKYEQTTFQSKLIPDPESIKIPNSESKLASILKSDPEPMTVSQIINTKILSLNTSKLKQFLCPKDEQLNKSSQWKKKKLYENFPKIKALHNENLQKCEQ